MKLTDQQRKVLAAVELDADKAVTVTARESALKTSTVQRTLYSLIESGVIAGKTAIVDLARLGVLEFGVAASLEVGSEDNTEEIIKELIRSPRVSWVAEVGSNYDLMFNVVASHPREVTTYLDSLSRKFPHVFHHKEIITRIERLRYWRHYFTGAIRKRPQYHMGKTADRVEIDERDRSILRELSTLRFESFRELARNVAMPISSFLRRIAKLQEQKLLLGFGYRLNVERYGVTQYRILIAVTNGSFEAFTALKDFASRTGRIKLLSRTLGAYDFDLEVDVQSEDELRSLTKDLKKILAGYRPVTQIVPILKHRKFISFPPIISAD